LKQIGFRLAWLAIGLALLEGSSWLLLRAAPDLGDRLALVARGLDPSARTRAAGRIGQQFADGKFTEEVVHPYLGFAMAPSEAALAGPLGLESLGLPGGGPLVRERRPDTVVMAVFGGSVAYYFGKGGGPERVFAGLQSLPAFAGKQLVVLNAAAISYKQPQSLMALAWLDALGAQLDLVVLLDGFNELNGPITEQIPAGVFPFFPGRWEQRVAKLDSATALRARIGEVAYLTERRAELGARFAGSLLSESRTATLLWALYDRRLERRVEAVRAELAESAAGAKLDYAAAGPPWPTADRVALYGDLADLWMRSSLEMRALAEAGGAQFFHFLQPNQHVPGTKPMEPDEIDIAIAGGERFAPIIATGYPFLRERGARLVERGVRFHDLTRVFEDTREPVYVDNIGHVGHRGNEIIADAIAAALRDDLGSAAHQEARGAGQ